MLTGIELGKAIELARRKKDVSKAALAREFGLKPPSIQGWVNTGRISKDMLLDLMEYFSDVVGPEHWGLRPAKTRVTGGNPRTIEIERLDIGGSMGKGAQAPDGYIDVVERLSVNLDYLRKSVSFTSPSNLAIITGFGDSMEPTFSDGDLLVVDRGVNEIKIDAVYVLTFKDELFIKRMQRRPGSPMLMLSDNTKYAPIEIKAAMADKFVVLGRVKLAWNAKRM